MLIRPAADERYVRDWAERNYDYVWLRLTHDLKIDDIGELYVPRLTSPSHPQIATRLPWSFDDPNYNVSTSWNRPLRIMFDPRLLPEAQTVELGLSRAHGRQLSVSSAWVGVAPRPVGIRYRIRVALQEGLPQTVGATLMVFAMFALGYWIKRRETVYAVAAAAMLAWCVRLVHYASGDIAPGPWNDWFWWASIVSMFWVMLFTYQFALRLHEMRAPWIEWPLVASAGAVTLLSVPILPFDAWINATLIYNLAAALSLIVSVAVTWHFFKSRSRHWGLLAGCLWISLGFGIHDVGLRYGWVSPESIYLMPLSAVLIFGVFAYAMFTRYVGAITDLERSNVILDERVNVARRALQDSYAELARVEAERAAIAERDRLVRDMHDGVGSALTSSLLLVEQGRLSEGAMADVLRQCIEDLRLTIDSTDAVAGDLITLLATLRFRLGNRLSAAGISMHWDVEELPTLDWLTAEASLQVLRIVQEALTNVIKHSLAKHVLCEITQHGDAVHIRIRDDGQGFDVATAKPGRGLANQRRRAASIGGTIDVTSGSSGTTLTLRLPIRAVRTPQATAAGSG